MSAHNRLVTGLTAIVAIFVFLIGLGAFTLSYDALYATGLENGVPVGKVWIWPLLIDAPLIVFTIALLVAQIMRQSIKLWASLVILYTVATIAFNLSHAKSTSLGWTVAMAAPVGLLLTTEALRHLAKTIIERQALISILVELTGQVNARQDEWDKLTTDLNKLYGQIENKRLELDNLKVAIAGTHNVTNATSSDTLPAFVPGNLVALDKAKGIKRDKIEERRTSVLTLLQEGLSPMDISERLGMSLRTIKRDIVALNGKAKAAQEMTSDDQGESAFDRIVKVAREDGRNDIADILTTAKRGWDRVNERVTE